jgi:GNAT superfamily N-acetyltransferase
MIELVYAPAVMEDAPRLADLRVRAMRESLEAIGRFDEQRGRERLLSDFAPDRTTLILSRGKLAGFYVLRDEGAEILLQHLYVEPALHSLGVGSQALQRIFDEANGRQRCLKVGALVGSASNRFYQRYGFQLVAQSGFDVYYVRAPSDVCFRLEIR